MNKNRLFILVSTLTLIILLGTAVTCNMCGMNLSTETTASTTKESQTSNTSAQVSETEETTKVTIAEDTNEEKTTDTAKSSSTETTKSSSTDSQAIAPTIKLQIYEGPTYSQADDVCYYRIEAIVTGSPTPTITFSKDDSNGAFGSKKVQVNLTKSNPSYTLTAKAKNTAGEATASINLDWGCGPSKVEKIAEFIASDTGTVGPNGYQGLQVVSFGDSQYNTDWRGRFSFDISSLKGYEIISAKVSLKYPQLSPNPCNFKGNIVIFYNDFLPDITSSDYYIASYAGPEVFAWDVDPLEFSNDFLKNKVKERVDSGIKLQFGIGYQNTNTGGLPDVFEGRSYYNTTITLIVTYYE